MRADLDLLCISVDCTADSALDSVQGQSHASVKSGARTSTRRREA